MNAPDFEDNEIDRILGAIFDRYGYDFRNYARSSLKRRMANYGRKHSGLTVAEVIQKLTTDRISFRDFLNDITISTTELFREPNFFVSFRDRVVPYLKTLSKFKIWHAGCSTGEEVFSLAILLSEQGLLDRALIYGTDINTYAVEKAKTGKVLERVIQRDSKNYATIQGKETLEKYWIPHEGFRTLVPGLLKKIVFGEHNLVTDSAFGEMNAICCKNVLIYFGSSIQNRALELFHSCLADGGFLCLGSKESLLGASIEKQFIVVDPRTKIYQKLSRGTINELE